MPKHRNCTLVYGCWCIGNFMPDTRGPASFGNKLPETPKLSDRLLRNEVIPSEFDTIR